MDERSRQSRRSLDSAYLVGFEKLRELTERVLRDNGDINFTQFRLLLKAAEKQGQSCSLSEVAQMVHLQPNVVSQAANALEERGFITRVVSARDARAKRIEVTAAGLDEIERLNDNLRDELYRSFNPDAEPRYKAILEETIFAAAGIETSLSPSFIAQHRASASLITYNIVLGRISAALHDALGISFNECRILQRLSEVDQPMRAVDLSMQMMVPPTTITRSANRLERRGLIVRLASDINRQAVFLDTTAEGSRCAEVVLDTIDAAADEMLWTHFDRRQQAALRAVGGVFLNNMRIQDAQRRSALLGDLKPVVR